MSVTTAAIPLEMETLNQTCENCAVYASSFRSACASCPIEQARQSMVLKAYKRPVITEIRRFDSYKDMKKFLIDCSRGSRGRQANRNRI